MSNGYCFEMQRCQTKVIARIVGSLIFLLCLFPTFAFAQFDLLYQIDGAAAHAAHDGHDIQATVRKYLIVFGALLVGTVLTVGMYYVHIPSVAVTIVVALFIASIKATLVACYFMHLIDERKMIYSILLATVFFFTSLVFVTLWAMQDPPSLTLHPAYQGK